MNKEYMLAAICGRIEELRKEYRSYFNTDSGPSKSISGAACMRSRKLKDIQTLQLLENLVSHMSDTDVLPDELVPAFDRLVEPRH